MLLGVHVSIAGHIYESVNRAAALGCNTMQIFSRDPQQWRKSKIATEDIEEFRARRSKYNISPVFIHVPYLINLASPYNILYQGSIRAYIEDVREAELLGADYIVTHMGSHKESGEEKGIKRITQALNKILDKTRGMKVGVLLENTSGSGSWLGYKFEHQKQIIAGIEDKSRVGICLDTCHAYAAGYDLASAEGYKKTIAELDRLVGLKLLKLVHINDTADKLGSRRDRHAHIGKGNIKLAGFKRLVNDSRLKDTAFILETPKDNDNADRINLDTVRKLKK
ncbi:MAG: deoxyribonuclease IV [Candidatus Omnitrophica bacterium]|nr:deoxyribonuclease IV [Candidatus Omnitrophota bacterium]MDD5079441.1 deoxyribonuclease IV [Candidatus Omnitrophota bacterium]